MVMLAKAEFPDSSLPNSPWSKTAGKDLLLICSPMPFIHSYISYMAERARQGARRTCSWLVCIGIEQSMAYALGVQHPPTANCAVRWTHCVHEILKLAYLIKRSTMPVLYASPAVQLHLACWVTALPDFGCEEHPCCTLYHAAMQPFLMCKDLCLQHLTCT